MVDFNLLLTYLQKYDLKGFYLHLSLILDLNCIYMRDWHTFQKLKLEDQPVIPKAGENRTNTVAENAANTKEEVIEEAVDAKEEVVVKAPAAKEEVIKEPTATKEEVIEKTEPISEGEKILPQTKDENECQQVKDVPEPSSDSNNEMSKTLQLNSEKAANDPETEDDDVIIVRRGHSIEKVNNKTPGMIVMSLP